MEKIVCSANHYPYTDRKQVHRPKNINGGIVIAGYGHHNCVEIASLMRLKDTSHVQGFISSKNNFYGRTEAMEIALKANQVDKANLHNPRIGLFSEDLNSPK